MKRPLAVLFLGACFALTGCATPIHQHGTGGDGAAAPPPKATSLVAASGEWADEGQRLIAYKAIASGAPNVLNNGPWAYESAPIDITGVGEYTLTFHVDPTFNLKPPTAIGFDFPSDTQFSATPAAPFTLVHDDNGPGQILQVPLNVSLINAPYLGFTVWIS
jgi:hypothetical protein